MGYDINGEVRETDVPGHQHVAGHFLLRRHPTDQAQNFHSSAALP